MTTYSEDYIERAVELAARRYANDIGGIVEETLSGYCAHNDKECVFFKKKDAGMEYHWDPCRYWVHMYSIVAVMIDGGERVEIDL